MKLRRSRWYALDHDKIKVQFDGDPQFVNEFCVNGEYSPSAVYYVEKPNLDKGHKNWMLLTKQNNQWFVRGMTNEEIEKWRYQDAIHCLECDEVIYSVNRHDYNKCSCNSVGIDGGREYTKTTWKPNTKYVLVTLDLLNSTISDPIKPHAKEEETKET